MSFKWATFDKANGTGTYKQHCFSDTGTDSLCGFIRPVDDAMQPIRFDDIQPEPFDKWEACMTCYREFQKRKWATSN